MGRTRKIAAALALAALVGAALPLSAGALPLLSPTPDAWQPATGGVGSPAVLYERLARTGIYRIRVEVTTHALMASVVRLEIGRVHRRLQTPRGERSAVVTVRLAVAHPTLLIRASSRHTRTSLVATFSRLSAIPRTPASDGQTRASGPRFSTGPTGPTGPTGATAVAAPALVAPTPAPAPAPPPPAPAPPRVLADGPFGDAGSWHSIFDEEFDGSSLNQSVWNADWLDPNLSGPMNTEEMECYSPTQAVVANGELDLNMIAAPQTNCPLAFNQGTVNEPYLSAMVQTRNKFDFTYGFLEARVWLPGYSGAASTGPASGCSATTPPTTVRSTSSKASPATAASTSTTPAAPQAAKAAAAASTPAAGTPSASTGNPAPSPGTTTASHRQVTDGITSTPMYIIANLSADRTYGGPLQAPASLRVDYIRVWQHYRHRGDARKPHAQAAESSN